LSYGSWHFKMMTLYVLHGADEYRKERQLKALRKELVNAEYGAFMHQILESPSLGKVLETINTSFFALGGLPVVEIHEFSLLHKSSEEDKKNLPPLIESIEAQASQKHLIFVSTKLDRKLKLPKWLSNFPEGQCLHFEVLPFYKQDETAQLLIQECQMLGIRIQMPAALRLVEFLGSDLRPLINECEKLHAFVNAEVIQVHHVEAFSVLDAKAFDIVDAWLQEQLTHRSVHDLNALLITENPLRFMALLLNRVEYFYRLKLGLAKGLSIDAIAQQEGKKSYPVQKDLQKMRAISLERLAERKRQLLYTEYQVKSGHYSQPKLALEELLLAL